MTNLNSQQIVTVLWILACAAYMPHDYHLALPVIGLLLEARQFIQVHS
jgi:hypothetical protein